MQWIFLAEILLFATLIPLFLAARTQRKRNDALDTDDDWAGISRDIEGLKNLTTRLAGFIASWDNDLEQKDKRAATVLIAEKARVKVAKDMDMLLEADMNRMRMEQRRREETDQQQVAHSILGMMGTSQSAQEVLSWAHGDKAEAAPAPHAPTTPARALPRASDHPTSAPTPASAKSSSPGGTPSPARPWRPEKVFAS